MLELRKLRPFQSRIISGYKCLQRVAKESIDEHASVREFLDIPKSTFIRVDKNLRTIASWADSIVMDMESVIDRVENCLSTVSI